MIIDFELAVADDRLRVSVPQARLAEDIPHVAACWAANGRIRALGKTREAMQAADPADWKQTGTETVFRAPFSIDGFERGLALVVIRIYVARAVQAVRPGALGLLMSGLWDSIRYDLRMPDFEGLPESERSVFIKELTANAPRVRELRINGQRLLP